MLIQTENVYTKTDERGCQDSGSINTDRESVAHTKTDRRRGERGGKTERQTKRDREEKRKCSTH